MSPLNTIYELPIEKGNEVYWASTKKLELQGLYVVTCVEEGCLTMKRVEGNEACMVVYILRLTYPLISHDLTCNGYDWIGKANHVSHKIITISSPA